ncbi:MAG: hypothetical protein WC455_18150 [Dehalococcoidia bacterium]|jgi:hypothetical protein
MKKLTFTEWIKRNKELCEQATKGPWIVKFDEKINHPSVAGPVKANKMRDKVALFPIMAKAKQVKRNAEFIAASRLSLPQAIRIIEALVECVPQCLTKSDARSVAAQIINEKE